jgi:hypothetical protein
MMDTVDMLHAAEDRVGTLTYALRELLAGYATAVDQGTLAVPGLFDAAKRAQDVLDASGHAIELCDHNSLRLVEGGYERTWDWEETDSGGFVAIFHGLEDFGDDGDGSYRLECSVCLQEHPLPDDWDWE